MPLVQERRGNRFVVYGSVALRRDGGGVEV